jgi:phytoene dehydrogenase-like protein
MTWDTVVIGSGPGGLTAALALARAGQRVLVLEQHYLPGGWTHSFSLEGYRFSPGVHYVGDLGEGGALRRLYEGLGVAEDLEFCEMNQDGFDHLLISGERFDQPKGLHRWIERLEIDFPHERAGIRRYFEILGQIAIEVRTCDTMLGFPEVLALPLRAPTLARWGVRTLDALLRSCIQDPMLRAVLSAQCGNHGLAPSRVSLPLHAAMAAHYYDGGYYPRGGAKRIPQAFIKELRKHRGEIRMRTRVAKILVENGRVAGVETADGERIEAPCVISNADPAVTYGKLLPAEHCPRQVRKVRRMEYSVSVVSVFAAVDLDLRAMGYDSGNYWWYRTTDVDRLYTAAEHELSDGELDGLFLAITSLKDPGHRHRGHHTLEMFTFVPYAAFERFGGTAQGDRGAAYQELKRVLGRRVLGAAEHIIPGISRHVRFLEVGTPLTNDFYCETHRGASYGTAKTPWQLGPMSFSQRGPVRGLHLCGASTIAHGVAGAAMSGLVSAQRILGLADSDQCLSATGQTLRIVQAEHLHEHGETDAPRVAA